MAAREPAWRVPAEGGAAPSGDGAEVTVRVDAPAGSHLWAVDEDACEPPGRGDPAADGRTVRVDILTAGDRRRVYARLPRRGRRWRGGWRAPDAADGGDGASGVDAEGESRGGKVVGIGWMLVLAGVLVSMAAGVGPGRSPLGTGGALAVVAGALGAFLSVSPARFWGKWTLGAVGVAAAAVVLLLIFTGIIRGGDALVSAGIAAAGFALAAAAVSFRMPWQARRQRGARRAPHQAPEEA